MIALKNIYTCDQVNPPQSREGHDIAHQEEEDKEGWVPRGFDKDGHPLDMSPMIRHDPEVNHYNNANAPVVVVYPTLLVLCEAFTLLFISYSYFGAMCV